MFDEESFHAFRSENTVVKKQKINRSELPRRARNFSKEQLNLALRKKKECNAKAQKIVETLLDPIEDEQYFLQMLRDINQSHFNDVIVERAIELLCGYPLCKERLESIPNQKFVISLSKKKVYDITERKNFCSGECFKSANYIKAQMLTSPLWLRDQEDIPTFRLLKEAEGPRRDSTGISGSSKEFITPINVDELKIVEKNIKEKPSELKDDIQKDCMNKSSEFDLSTTEDDNDKQCDREELDAGMAMLSLSN